MNVNEDIKYLLLAKENVTHSTCLSHPIGTLLLLSKGYHNCEIRIGGWNGAPGELTCKKLFGVCPRKSIGVSSGMHMELCSAVHAERRPILIAAHRGLSTSGSTLYAWCGIPCKDCAIELIEAGVKRIVCLDDDKFERKQPTSYNFKLSMKLLDKAGVKIKMYKEIEVKHE
jgi:dCMP deaminase